MAGDVGGATRGEKKGAKWRIKEKTVGALRTQGKRSREEEEAQERGQFIFHPDILGTWTQSCRQLRLRWNQCNHIMTREFIPKASMQRSLRGHLIMATV